MGKRRLLTGMISGAMIGCLVSLFNDDARGYAKDKLCDMRKATTNVINNPTEAVHTLKQSVIKLSSRVSTESNNALNALEQIENTLEKVTKRIG